MKAYRHLHLILAATLLVTITAIPVGAQVSVPAQDDTWTTNINTQVDFSNFGSIDLTSLLGGTPTSTVVNFTGVPLSSAIGQADTLLSRGAIVNATGSKYSASLSLQALHLSSTADITLQNSRNTYHVDVQLADQSGGGHLDFTQTSSDGGTYSSSFDVHPVLVFTNTFDTTQQPITVNCTDTKYNCNFPMSGGGNWLFTSQSGFDPSSQGIPTVPSGVQLGSYTTVGRARYGGIQVGCGGTRGTSYHCNSQDQQDELHGILGQANGHDVQPPNDCASSSTSPSAPSPTSRSITTSTDATSTTTSLTPTPVASICATTQ